jgi:hypothetical protein
VHRDGEEHQVCIVQIFFPKGRQTLLSLLGTREKNFSFHFKGIYLTIRAVKFCEIFSTCSPSSLGQDPMVESAKEKLKKIHLGLFSKKWQFWGVF